MIKYSLKCAEGHVFDSWFASADAFEALDNAGQLHCTICGSGEVTKALMAPRVATSRKKTRAGQPDAPAAPVSPQVATPPNLSEPGSAAEAAIAEFRTKVEENTVDVGTAFAQEARAIHEGTAPGRAIRGQANAEEARALLDDGVPVLPLPFPPTRQVN